MGGWRKLIGLGLCTIAVVGLAWAPAGVAPTAVGGVVALYGAFCAANYGEHKAANK